MIRTSSPQPAGSLPASQQLHCDRLCEIKAAGDGGGFYALSWPAPPSPVLPARPPTPPQSSTASDSRRIFLKKRRSSQLKNMASVSLKLASASTPEENEDAEDEDAQDEDDARSPQSPQSPNPSSVATSSSSKLGKSQRAVRAAALAQSLAAASEQPAAHGSSSSRNTPCSPASPTRSQNKAIRFKGRAASTSKVAAPGQPTSPYVSSPMVAVAYRSSAGLRSASSPNMRSPIRRGSSHHDVPRPLARRDSKPQMAFPRGRPSFLHINTDRAEAEQLLVADGMRPGTYLLREKTPNHAYALSFVDLQGIGHALITRAERSDGRIGMHWLLNTLRLWECETIEDVLAHIECGLVMPNHELDIPVLHRPLDAPDNSAA